MPFHFNFGFDIFPLLVFLKRKYVFLNCVFSSNANLLIPNVFNFLVLLSYERYHTKTIIQMPKVIQLCDGIMASGQDPTTHGDNANINVILMCTCITQITLICFYINSFSWVIFCIYVVIICLHFSDFASECVRAFLIAVNQKSLLM